MVSLQAESIVNTVAFPMVFKAALELGVIDTIAAAGKGACMALTIRDNAEPVCKYFLKDSDGSGSLASLFLLFHTQVHFNTWTNLKDVILNGTDAFIAAQGMRLFEYISSDEQFGEVFHRAMSESATMVMKKVLEVYKGFEDVNTLVDVGGATGTILGVEHVSGDMFIEVPKGDAVFMKWILHDWTDEHCVKILKNCWKSLPEKGKVIIVEMITPVESKSGEFFSNTVFAMDLLMLTQCSSGKERSLLQFENLAFDSGFLRCEIICHAYSYSVIEFHK
ncbi:unnamed protein product [Thlaspi arvense]|uniref:O-methyltransferase C-terminal domain-containing protein n=1 Tax=Thlaspi arvense TaxID=13288 RepID=A0AAU9SGV6_THLAR|nr:unnamed protein product [Thlaspi arvense]